MFIYCINICKGLIWFVLTALDNRVRFSLHTSPLVKTYPKLVSYEKVPPVIATNTQILLERTEPLQESKKRRLHLNGIYVHHISQEINSGDYNIAICLRMILEIRQRLQDINIKPSSCYILRNPSSYGLDGLYKCFAGIRAFKEVGKDHYVDKLITLKKEKNAFWRLWTKTQDIEEFRNEVLASHGIKKAPAVESVQQILFIRRHNMNIRYDSKGQNTKKIIVRKISNEKKIFGAVRRHFPSLNLAALYLEKLSISDQIKVINKADIVIGMHGAGLGYNLLMKPNSGLLEMFPLSFVRPHQFYTFYAGAASRRLHYYRYLQPFPWREKASKISKRSFPLNPPNPEPIYTRRPLKDYTHIPPSVVIKGIHQLIKEIEGSAQKNARE